MSYELRIDDKLKESYSIVGLKEIEDFLKSSKENPDSKVEIVHIGEHLLLNGFNYHLMERRFNKIKPNEKKGGCAKCGYPNPIVEMGICSSHMPDIYRGKEEDKQ